MAAKDFFPNIIPDPVAPTPRQSINLLPGYLQTTALSKFLGITLDQLIQPAQQENVSGYIGEKGGLYYDPTQDFYLKEQTPSRNDYQLEPTAVSIDNNNNTNFVEFYQDMVNSLEFDGALVNNHSRLFSEEYYSWAPPINPDMFVNFTNYFWVQVGPEVNVIPAPTNAVLDIIGQTSYSITYSTGTVTNPTFNVGDTLIINGVSTTLTGTTLAQTVIDLNNEALIAIGANAAAINNQLVISVTGTSLVMGGNAQGEAGLDTTTTFALQSGMKIQLNNDANTEYNGVNYIVEGVGESISLIDDTVYDDTDRYDIPGYDTTPYDGFAATTNPDYWTIRRDSQDGNPWSRTNRWFHKDVLGSLNLGETTFIQATRPIIEFLPNIELRNFGRWKRPDVKLISTTDSILSIIGQSSYTVDGLQLQDGYNILITGDPDSTKNNRVYTVFGLEKFGRIGLSVVLDGLDPTGAPVEGEVVKALSGLNNGGSFYYYNGTEWVEGQQKTADNQPPIYNLYDLNAVRLDNASEYPGSNFNGSQIFSYTPTGTVVDPVLGIDLTFDTFGDIGFTDFLTYITYTYISNNTTTNIGGYYFYRQFTTPADTGADLYENDWHKSATESRQLVYDEFVITPLLDNLNLTEFNLFYQLSIVPDVNAANLPVNRRAYLNGQILVENVDYEINGSILQLSETLALAADDVLEVETWAQTIPELLSSGYFEIPTNLSGNPNNEQITQRSFNEIAPQLISIIQNQSNLVGSPNGANNFLNTSRDLSRGQLLLNHAASLLRVALLTGNPNTKLTDSIRYSNLQYTTFKNKFLIKLQQFINQGLTSQDSTSVWISEALAQINLGKTTTFPFAYSAMTNGNNYIPSTPSALGVTPTYLPQIYLDTTKVTPAMVIQGHDGSLYNTYGDYRDQVILALETNIYQNIDPSYNAVERVLEFDQNTIIPGYFRSTDYSRSEFLQISQPGFERWAVRERLDYVKNTTYDPANIFTWNFSNVAMPNGQLAPGHWRGIFQYFYDTYRPHTSPWEMLGFSQEPTWWQSVYGPAPYTKENIYMWTDLENGVIRQGPRAGTYPQYARPNLHNLIPVDGSGNILDPVTIGLVTSSPNEVDAQANWKFGDSGPIEFLWRIGSSYPYDLSEALFLAKPARFVDTFWEARKIARDQGQIYDIDLGRRFTSADLDVHNEILTNGTRAVVKGISNWISDYLANLSLNIATNFGDLQRFLNVKLAYKSGSFIKQDTLRLNSDSFGLVPSENVTIKLYKSASIAQPIYSAVIVIWDGTSYRISGYDTISQHFTIMPGIETGTKAKVTIGNSTVNRLMQTDGTTQDVVYYTSFNSRQAVYNFFVGYQNYLESQGWVFPDFDSVNGVSEDFINAANNFISWSNNPLDTGAAIIFSPCSQHLVYTVDHGHVENIGQFVNGVYGVLDRTGYGIATSQFGVSRNNSQFEVTLNSNSVQGIYCLRLSIVEYEHIILIDNTTDFGNLVYDPILGIRQPRFQLFANRTMFWTGEPTAAGFIVQDDDLTDNFEQSVNNFRQFYDFDINPATGIQGELAQHTIGYQERDYLDNLLLDTNTEFDYYKGFIGAKGTVPSFSNILRSNYITKTAGFTVLEEWAFRIGEYGNTERKSGFEIQIRQSDFTTDPQLIDFVPTVGLNPTYIDMVPTDSRWVLKNRNNSSNNQFKFRDFQNRYRKDLPNAGYVQINETTYNILNTTALTDPSVGLFNTVVFTNSSRFNDGDTIWQIILDNGGWTVYRVCQDAQLASIQIGANPSDPTVITTVTPHDLNPGDTLFFQDSTATSGDLQGINTVLNTAVSNTGLTSTQFSIADTIDTGIVYPTTATGTVVNPLFTMGDTLTITIGSLSPLVVTISANGGLTQAVNDISAALKTVSATTTATATQSNQLQISDSTALPIVIDTTTQVAIDAGLPANAALTGPYVYVLKVIRFPSVTSGSLAPSFTPFNGWLQGDKVFVDNNGINLWEVQQFIGTPILGTVSNPVFDSGDTLTINDTEITVTGPVTAIGTVTNPTFTLTNLGTTLNPTFPVTALGTVVDPNFSIGDVISINGTYITLFGPINADGSQVSPTFNIGDTLIINGTNTVTMTGTTLAQAVIDINAAAIPNISATGLTDQLQVVYTGTGFLTLSGAVQTEAGLPTAAYIGLDQAVAQINSLNIYGVVAYDVSGQLQITNSSGPLTFSGQAATDAGLPSSVAQTLIINGTTVSFTGSSLASAISNINSAAIPGILASNLLNHLQIFDSTGGTLTISGTAQSIAGLATSMQSEIIINGITINLTGATLAQTITDINNATIPDVTASNNVNRLQIVYTGSGDLTIAGSVQTIAGLPATAYVSITEIIKQINDAAITGITASNSNNQLLITSSINPSITISGSAQSKAGLASSNTTSWNVVRTETDKIDIDQIYNSYIYDSITNQDVLQVQLYDPYKGIIFSAADAEISYKLDFDPAKYSNGDATVYQIIPEQAWGDQQVGQLWWDLSTTRFLDYEQGTLDYKRKNWGSLAPGVTVNIYEWVKSPVPPSGWNAYVLATNDGTANAPTGTPIYDSTGVDTPYVTITTYSTAQNVDVVSYYFWVLNPTSLPEGLVSRNLPAAQVQALIQNQTGQSIVWLAPIAPNAFVINNADNYINNQSSILQVTFFELEDESIIHRQWILLREYDEINPPYQALWNKMRDSLVGFDDLNLVVPDPTLSNVVMFGNAFRPRQTWFEDRIEARLEFFTKVNEILLTTNVISISGYNAGLMASDPLPNVTAYDYEVATRADRDALDNKIVSGSTVLVTSDEDLSGYWTLWTYNGQSSWTLNSQERYRATDYYVYADWYATGFSASSTPNFTYSDISEMNANSSLFTSGDLILVQDNGTGNFSLYQYTVSNSLSEFTVVGQQNGTIQFLANLWNYNTVTTAYDATNAADFAASTVAKSFIEALQDNLLTVLEQNAVFFAMVHYAHFEQSIIPWAFKASTLYGQGQLIPFRNDYILPADETDDLVSFFQEAKPYHVKLRTLTEQRRTQTDIADVQATDSSVFTINLIFDRVSITAAASGQTPTAVDRIIEYYAPSEGMPPKVLAALISRGEFAGTILDGRNFYQFGTILSSGYDNQPYDDTYLGGYDFSDANILGTGLDPVTAIGDTFIINGATITMTGTTINSAIDNINLTQFLLGQVVNPTFNVNDVFVINGQTVPMVTNIITGTIANPVNLEPNDLITINGQTVLMTGSTIAQAKIDIDTALIPHIVATDDGMGHLVIEASAGYFITQLSGNLVQKMGLTISLDQAIELINANSVLSSAGIIAIDNGNTQLEIYSSEGNALTSSGVAAMKAGLPPTSITLNTLGIFASSVSQINDATQIVSQVIQLTDKGNVDLYLGGSALATFGFAPLIQNNQLTPSTLESYYDIFVNGGNPLDQAPSFTEPAQTDSTINVDGNKLIQPYLDANHPEELVSSRVGDAVIIDVYTYDTQLGGLGYDSSGYDTGGYDTDSSDNAASGIRFPKHRVKRYFGVQKGTTGLTATGTVTQPVFNVGDTLIINGTTVTLTGTSVTQTALDINAANIYGIEASVTKNNRLKITNVNGSIAISGTAQGTAGLPNTGSFTIGQLPQNKQALFVHKNGILLKLNNQYTVDWDAATVTLTDLLYDTDILVISSFSAGGGIIVKKKTYKNTSATTFDLKVAIPAADNVYAMVDGNIATVTTSGTVVTIVDPIPNNSTVLIVLFNSSSFSTVLTETQIVTPSSPSTFQFNVTRPADSTVPKYLTTDVYLNEKRLSPPPMAIYTQDNVTVNFALPVTATNTSDINVWADSILLTQGVGYTATTTSITLIGTPVQGTILAVQVNENGDYTITGNEQVTINVPTQSNDILQVTTYSEDDSYQMFTESYLGNSTNQFTLGVKPYNTDSLIVYLNGLLLTFGKDYKLVDPTTGYDSERDDNGGDGFASSTTALTVQITNQQTTDTDKIVMTYFTQFPSQDPIAFRMYKNIFGNYQFLRISDENSTTLTAPLLNTDNVVVVNDATVLGTPDIASQTPGVVFINGERITYWSVDITTPGAHQLLQCMRGTQGTGINIDLAVGTVVRDASLDQEIPGNSWDWHINPNGLQYSNDPQGLFLQKASGSQDFGQ